MPATTHIYMLLTSTCSLFSVKRFGSMASPSTRRRHWRSPKRISFHDIYDKQQLYPASNIYTSIIFFIVYGNDDLDTSLDNMCKRVVPHTGTSGCHSLACADHNALPCQRRCVLRERRNQALNAAPVDSTALRALRASFCGPLSEAMYIYRMMVRPFSSCGFLRVERNTHLYKHFMSGQWRPARG